jgi:hypothetical protein
MADEDDRTTVVMALEPDVVEIAEDCVSQVLNEASVDWS